MSEPLHRNFREFLEHIIRHEVIFMVVGGAIISLPDLRTAKNAAGRAKD